MNKFNLHFYKKTDIENPNNSYYAGFMMLDDIKEIVVSRPINDDSNTENTKALIIKDMIERLKDTKWTDAINYLKKEMRHVTTRKTKTYS